MEKKRSPAVWKKTMVCFLGLTKFGDQSADTFLWQKNLELLKECAVILSFFPVVFYHCPHCYVDWLAGHRHVDLWRKPTMFDPLCTNGKGTFTRLS